MADIVRSYISNERFFMHVTLNGCCIIHSFPETYLPHNSFTLVLQALNDLII
jgi:hypothetical protein